MSVELNTVALGLVLFGSMMLLYFLDGWMDGCVCIWYSLFYVDKHVVASIKLGKVMQKFNILLSLL